MRSECGNTPVHRFEMKMKIVTSGSAYLDIDAYAGCIACAELLNVLGEPAKALSSAPLNDSICASLRALARGERPPNRVDPALGY